MKPIRREIPRAFINVWVFIALTTMADVFFNPALGQETPLPQTSLFHNLMERLFADGLDRAFLSDLFEKDQVRFDSDTVSLFFVHSESKLDYDQFTLPQNILAASQYMTTHAEKLLAAENNYDVDQEVITAIILVETRLGTYTGKSSILDTLSTMAALSDSVLRDYMWDQIPSGRRFERRDYEDKALKKSEWAYAELKAFLTYSRQEGISPTAVKGSYAGALGISQFMPSNILKLGKDGNADGRIDLFDHADAIMSIASYLQHHGWRRGMDRDGAYRVILRYNNSKYYANTILKISDLLKASI